MWWQDTLAKIVGAMNSRGRSAHLRAIPAYLARTTAPQFTAMLMSIGVVGAFVLFRDAIWSSSPAHGHSPGAWMGIIFAALITPTIVGGTIACIAHRRMLRAARTADHTLCGHCLHDLRGLGERGRCSECGRPFEASALRDAWSRLDRRTHRSAPRRPSEHP